MRSHNGDLFAFFIIGLILAALAGGAALERTVGLGLVLPPPTAPGAGYVEPVPSPTPALAYDLYFTDPAQTAALAAPSGGIPARMIASLDQAQQTLDVAVYEFDLLPIAEALQRAAQRGVRVRLVTDSDTLADPEAASVWATLAAANIPVVGDDRSAIMHHKFIVQDGQTVWLGSMNFTRNDAYRNNNAVLRVTSRALAENYTREFEELFIDRRFGPLGVPDTPHPTLTIGTTAVENYFSPDDGIAAQILEELNAADRSIYFMAFSFTRTDFAEALLERSQNGVTVQGVFETRQIAAGGDAAWQRLLQGGLAVRQDGNPYNLHTKAFIIDLETVVFGSYNFSRNAEENNDENVLIVHAPAFAAQFYAEWRRVWEEAGR